MNIEINFVHAQRSEKSEEHVTAKLNGLYEKYDWMTNAAVFLKEEKHDNDENCECEIRLSVPGPQLFAKAHNDNFFKAINSVIDELGIQLQKKKSKMQAKR